MEQNNKTKPWTEPGSIWKTESTYWSWVRGQLRKSWTKYPVKNHFIRENRFKKVVGTFKNGNPKTVFCGICNECKKTFPLRKLKVDHIKPAGTLKGPEHLEQFITNLFCSYSNMQFICDTCHNIKTYIEKYPEHNLTTEDVARMQTAKRYKEMKASKQKTELAKLGATDLENRNSKTRIEFINKHFNLFWL